MAVRARRSSECLCKDSLREQRLHGAAHEEVSSIGHAQYDTSIEPLSHIPAVTSRQGTTVQQRRISRSRQH